MNNKITIEQYSTCYLAQICLHSVFLYLFQAEVE